MSIGGLSEYGRILYTRLQEMLCSECLAILPQKGQPGRWVCTSDFCKVCNWNVGFSGLRHSPFMYHARGVIARVSKLLVRP